VCLAASKMFSVVVYFKSWIMVLPAVLCGLPVSLWPRFPASAGGSIQWYRSSVIENSAIAFDILSASAT
jgi:hypothetical protein